MDIGPIATCRGNGDSAMKRVKARFTNGAIVPLEPLDVEEGQELLITLEETPEDDEEAEDAALARAISEGLSTTRVDKQSVLEVLGRPDGA